MCRTENLRISKITLSSFVVFVLIFLCYYFLDRPISLWLYSHGLQKERLFSLVTYIPNLMVYGAIILSALLIFSKRKIYEVLGKKFSSFIIMIAFSTYLSIVFSMIFKYIFGRLGPKYWIMHNLSPSAYGFFLFHGMGPDYRDFPSGHSAVSFAIISVICYRYPKLTPIALMAGFLIIASLLLTQSHYLGDCIGGAFLGSLIGLFTARFFNVEQRG